MPVACGYQYGNEYIIKADINIGLHSAVAGSDTQRSRGIVTIGDVASVGAQAVCRVSV